MFSTRTRIVGLGICVLWILFFTGRFQPFARPAPPPPPRATVPQYLPWASGTTARVNQGNGGSFSHFNEWNRYAWDFGLPLGTPLYAGVAGTVEIAADGCAFTRPTCNTNYGNTVAIRAADGTCARFAHLNTVAVFPGQTVAVGTKVGTVGSTGHSTGPHLHYLREICGTGVALPSSFVEAGVPRQGADVTSALPPG
ncbi:M23 family metallopeptidase [Solirubrobacter soli]|uniref:M23 family metallopeptidase n=1 Tax=Solirubrobacter soli TaxID=363832 RepID=UPI00146BA885|nr:M23 family metallopeptidase [Solirubrobacter soli]